MHHLTSGVKSLATEMVYMGLDEMRQACGGAGFLLSSGIAEAWGNISPYPTFEGTNPVMVQQASRLIFKNLTKIAKGKQPGKIFAYLGKLDEMIADAQNSPNAEISSLDYIERTLAVRSAFAIHELNKLMNASDASSKEKLNEIFALDISRIVRLHVIYMTFKLSRERI